MWTKVCKLDIGVSQIYACPRPPLRCGVLRCLTYWPAKRVYLISMLDFSFVVTRTALTIILYVVLITRENKHKKLKLLAAPAQNVPFL